MRCARSAASEIAERFYVFGPSRLERSIPVRVLRVSETRLLAAIRPTAAEIRIRRLIEVRKQVSDFLQRQMI